MRIIFMGTPEFAVGTLSALVEGGYDVVCCVTQPDRPVGRHGSVLQPPAVKVYAQQHGIPVLQPEKMRDPDFLEQLRSYAADLQVVVAFRMLPEVVWAMPRYGTFNVHAALLPQYRGAAPINWAIINGETETGVTTFFLDHDIDTGRIIEQYRFPIPPDADVEYVYDGLMTLGARAAISTVDKIIAGGGQVESMPQPEAGELKPAPKIYKDTCHIDWSQPAAAVHNFVRGLSPVPGAWGDITLPSGERAQVKVYRTSRLAAQPAPCNATPGSALIEKRHLYIACAGEWLEVMTLQPAGKKRMQASDWINGIKK